MALLALAVAIQGLASTPVTVDMLVVFAPVLLALVFFVTEGLPIDVTTILVMVPLIALEPWTQITPREGIAGVANHATVTVLAMLILSNGINRTGLVQLIGRRMASFARTDRRRRPNVEPAGRRPSGMAEVPDERQLVIEAESQLERWTNEARTEAYAELFDGDDPILTAEELRVLDAIDSAMERRGGDGIWGTDQYGVHTAGTTSADRPLGIVCAYHPRITSDSVLRGGDGLDDETEERLNAALWRYSNRVAALIEDELDEYLRRRER